MFSVSYECFSVLCSAFLLKSVISSHNSCDFIGNQQKKIKMGVVLEQNLGQIRSNVMKKVKKQALSLGFFHILLGKYLLKQKAVVIKPPEWKFMAIIAR